MPSNDLDRPEWEGATNVWRPAPSNLQARIGIEGQNGGAAIEGPGPWLIGRDPACDVAFPDDRTCSRQQARIARAGLGFVIEPLSHSVPTTLDGAPVTAPAPLHDGARLAFGLQRLVFTLIQADFADVTAIGGMEPIEVAAEAARGRIVLDRNLTVGRQDCMDQVVLDHPTVSRRHAAFEHRQSDIVVRDLGSANGTFVNGARIDRPTVLAPGDRIDIGPYQFTFDGSALSSEARTGNAELVARGVSFDVRPGGKGRNPVRILHDATFRIRPRDFVCIIGASGSGKSTLMNILAGRVAPGAGSVSVNGTDLHASFQALKQDIAFVPQQDVLHEHLTLRQALDYAARLRLPADTSAEQRRETVEVAARSVDLFDRLETRIGLLSGGQKKRASLASEILNRPSLLFLDEVTSGLDESTDWEIMRLLRRLADEGMTIVVVTHTLANVEAFCHTVVCMGRGGRTAFVGAPGKALEFFGVQRLGEVFNRIEADGAATWQARFNAIAAAVPAPADGAKSPLASAGEGLPRRLARAARQFGILTHRNTRLLLADRRGLAMAAVQSCLIGGLMGYAFGSFGTGQEVVKGKTSLLFLIGLTSLWLGCNGASKDIVGELAIYKRERDINLSTAAFVASKYVVTSVFTALQLGMVFLLTALLAERIPGAVLTQLGILVAGGLAGTAIGLTISAFSDTRDQATTIVPLALVPQIILAGILVPRLPGPAELFAKVAVSSYWLTEAMKSAYIAAEGPVRVISARTGALVDLTAEPAWKGGAIVVAHAAIFVLIAYAATLLRYRTSGKGGQP